MRVDEEWLQSLVADQREEHEQLEFKLILPTRDDEGKKEFLKDVAAMANANGGQIVYGIRDEDGTAVEVAAAGAEIPDETERRLGQSLDSSVEPRIPGVSFQSIPLAAGGYALVVTIPRSFTGPHRVTLKNKNAFYLRTQRYVSEFSYTQLRDAFTLRGRAEDRMQAFRAERLTKVKNNDGARSVQAGCCYALHLMPLVSFSGPTTFETSSFREHVGAMVAGGASYSDYRNLDGAVASVGTQPTGAEKYVQLFRSGVVEVVAYAGAHHSGEKIIHRVRIADGIRRGLPPIATRLSEMEIRGPIAIAASLLSTQGHTFPAPQDMWGEGFRTSDREDLVLPEIWVESIEAVLEDVDTVVRPILDMLWQCFDQDRCDFYDATGKWAVR
jgi:hypothetical protein